MSLDFTRDGVAVHENIASGSIIDRLAGEFDCSLVRVGARPFAPSATVLSLIALNGALTQLARRLAERDVRPVRILTLNKTAEANWHLPWHQDRVVALRRRVDAEGFENWTLKGGRVHAEAPVTLLETLFSLRLHIDANDTSNGALKVVPGSHCLGRLTDREVRDVAASHPHHVCVVAAGGVVAMRSLTIHASDASQSQRPRRVLHLDYCFGDLPRGLEWALDWIPGSPLVTPN
ncbi:MAG: phytanoyl-CoA dioxygenase family protein [Parvibaculaceae bacterium]